MRTVQRRRTIREQGWKGLPLWLKVVAVVSTMLIAAVAVTGALTYKVSRDLLRAEIIAAGRGAVADFATTNTLDFLDEKAGRLNLNLRAEQLLRGASGKSRVVGVHVYGRDTALIAKAGKDTIVGPKSEALAHLEGSRVVAQTEDGIAIAAPVVYGGVRLGTVVFDFSAEMYSSVVTEILIRSIVIVTTLMALSAICLIILLKRLLRPVVELGEAAEQFALGDYSHRIDVKLSGDEVGRAARSFNNMLDALELHMRFSNGALVDRIRHGGTDEAREYQLTVAFGDAKDYTSWSQQRTPPEVFQTLSRYFTVIGRITVLRFHGIIDKFIGDGVMTHFGLLRDRRDPRTADPESVRDALRAIITTQLAIRVLSQAIRAYDKGVPLAYRFGIASGRCLVGAVGARDVMLDYSVIGNVVNLASRLEHLAPPGGLLIDRFTHIDAGEGFVDVLDGGKQTIKGVNVPIQVFYVRGLADPRELAQVRSFLLDTFFDDDTLDGLMLTGRSSHETRAGLRDFLARELEERPGLPTPALI
jgi:class 3 adenylate cyclase